MSLGNTFLVILLYSLIDYTSADAIHLLMVNNVSCSMINEVDQFDSYQLNWNGDVLPPNCKLGFTGKSFLASEAHDKYRVCVKTFVYNIGDCNFKMKFYCNDKINPAKEYTCGTEQPPTFCAPDNLFIGLSSLASSTSSFQLIVSAEKTYTAPEENIYLVYSVVAGLSILCVLIICTIVLVVCKKHKQVRQARTVDRNSTGLYNNAPTSMIQGAAFPTGMHNQGYFNTEQDFHPRAVSVSLPAYSEKEEKKDPPAYTEVNDNGTKT